MDYETDRLIQLTIRSEFRGSTVITVAHRMNTVMDADRMLVLADGEVAEYDSPRTLLHPSYRQQKLGSQHSATSAHARARARVLEAGPWDGYMQGRRGGGGAGLH